MHEEVLGLRWGQEGFFLPARCYPWAGVDAQWFSHHPGEVSVVVGV